MEGFCGKRMEKDILRTSQSFCNSKANDVIGQNTPFITQIQKLVSTLVQNKGKLKEEQLKKESLKEKQSVQEEKIGLLRIQMDHEVEKQKIDLNNRQRLEEIEDKTRGEIKLSMTKKNQIMNRRCEKIEKINEQKRICTEMKELKRELESALREKKIRNNEIDQHINNLESMINYGENEFRQKQDFVTKLKLQENELNSLIKMLKEKVLISKRQRNNETCKRNTLNSDIIKMEQKINNLRKERNEIEWSCDQTTSQNNKIEELNEKLKNDLEKVKLHLQSMNKINKTLKLSLTQYDMASQKIARIIIH